MFRASPAALLAVGFITATSAAQQLPDILLPNIDERVTGTILRLTDRNGDGFYDSNPIVSNEVYDWFRYEPYYIDSSFRNVIRAPSRPGAFYTVDFGPNSPEVNVRIGIMQDLNLDGWINTSELSPALTNLWLEETDTETEAMAYDGAGFVWVANAGNLEGLYFSRDLNGDLDFMDAVGGVDETICLIAESANRTARGGEPAGGVIGSSTWTIHGTSSPATFNPTEVKSVTCDTLLSPGSLAGQSGILPCKYIFDDNVTGMLLALEDLNGDGDFLDDSDPNSANWDTDPGELYIWLNLNTTGPLGPGETNPDAGVSLPTSEELEDIAIDMRSPQHVYYVLDATQWTASSMTDPAANTIYRAVDFNFDGDVNDAGEVSVFFTAKENDPIYPMDEFSKLAFWEPTGDIYLVGDKLHPNGDQEDVVVRLHDDNNNNVIEVGLGEATEVYALGYSAILRTPNLFAPGSAGLLPPGLPGIVDYRNSPSCTTTGGTTNVLTIGGIQLGDRTPLLGQVLRVTNEGATPSAASALWIGDAQPAPISLSLLGLGPCSIASLPQTTVPFTTNIGGSWTWQFAVPNNPAFVGAEQALEAVTLDLLNARVDVSNMAVLRYGYYAYTSPIGPQ